MPDNTTKASTHAYIPQGQSNGPTLYHKNSDVEFNDPVKPIKIKIRGEEYVLPTKTNEQKQEMRNNATFISNITDNDEFTAKEQIDHLIKTYMEKIFSYGNHDHADFESMSRDVHILLLLNASKDGASAKDLQDIAELNVLVYREKNKDLHNSNIKLFLGGAAGVAMLGGSVYGIQAIARGLVNSKQIVQTANLIIQGSSGVKSIEAIHDSRNEGEKVWVNATQRIDQEKEAQHRDDVKQALNMQQGTIQKLSQLRQNEFQTKQGFVRNNF
ncbi:MAG: hypothetical protein WC222_06025 [Parachlamydiales bacterium]|jgi:hypothetical protein